jgi:hypothetical protein
MFTYSTPEINTFESMYNSADQSPVLVAIDSLSNILIPLGIGSYSKDDIKAWPTISMDGKVNLSSDRELIRSAEVVNSAGKVVSRVFNTGFQGSMSLYLPQTAGVYHIRVYTDKKIIYKKVVKS